MIRGQFVLVVEEELSQEEQQTLQYLLADALSDFRHARKQNATEYVNERYGTPDSEYWLGYGGTYERGLAAYNDKVEQVEKRLSLARKLHNAALQVTAVPESRMRSWVALLDHRNEVG